MPDDKGFDKIPDNMWFLEQLKTHLNKAFKKKEEPQLDENQQPD